VLKKKWKKKEKGRKRKREKEINKKERKLFSLKNNVKKRRKTIICSLKFPTSSY